MSPYKAMIGKEPHFVNSQLSLIDDNYSDTMSDAADEMVRK